MAILLGKSYPAYSSYLCCKECLGCLVSGLRFCLIVSILDLLFLLYMLQTGFHVFCFFAFLFSLVFFMRSLKVLPFVGTLQCVPLNTAVPVQVHTPGETQEAVLGVQDSGTPTVHVPLPTVASANRH